MMRRVLVVSILAVACHGKQEDKPEVRQVLTMVVGKADREAPGFVGRIEPRYKIELAFRVGGRVVRRSHSVGDQVRRGDEIAALDPKSLLLAVSVANANVAGGDARGQNAQVTLARQAELLARGSAPAKTIDEARESHATAVAGVSEAEARLQKAREDLSYAVLRAEFDGEITRLDFEVEQVVSPNVTVAEMARPDVLDVVFDAPESVARDLGLGDPFTVRSADPPFLTTTGKVRQIDPAAERITRTHHVWIGLDTAPTELRLGTTMYAEPKTARRPPQIPLSAIVVGDAGGASVWIVEGDVVVSRPVTLGPQTESDAVVLDGLRDGERVVTAGVHSLGQGQHIKLPQDADQ